MKTRLRELREERHLTQEALAARCGLNHHTISEIECEIRKNVYISTLSKLAKGLGVDVEDIVRRREDAER
jgi:transcriptional regulator with XRE-family HTH domain